MHTSNRSNTRSSWSSMAGFIPLHCSCKDSHVDGIICTIRLTQPVSPSGTGGTTNCIVCVYVLPLHLVKLNYWRKTQMSFFQTPTAINYIMCVGVFVWPVAVDITKMISDRGGIPWLVHGTISGTSSQVPSFSAAPLWGHFSIHRQRAGVAASVHQLVAQCPHHT